TVEISAAVSSSSFSESVIYRVPIQYGSTGGVWQSLTPDKYSPSFGSYRVDVLSLANTTNFRLVRVAGSVSGVCNISVRVLAGSDLTFTFQSIVSTDTTIPSVYDDGRPGKLYSSIVPSASSVSATGTYGQVNITYINLPVGNFDIWGNVSVNCSSAIMYQAGAWVEAPGGTTPDQCYRAYSSSSGTANISLTIPTRNITVTTPISIYMVISYSTTASTTITICGSLYARRF
ncbi:MAG: hypothetical protein P4L51_21025, partial [Puia sp.]|nr:hypothetical protein [Puia sp.]